MCIPKDNSVNFEAELVRNENDCHSDFYWNDNNKLCLNLEGKCHSFKHKGVCNLFDKCLWQESDTNSQSRNSYEFGYCRDISSSLKRVEV